MELKTSIKDAKDCQKILQIEVPKERALEEYESFYRSAASKAKIPGFRPGKAPREVLVMYFKEEARQEVLKHLLAESYAQAIREKSLEPLGYPEIKDVRFEGDTLSYSAVIETRPKVKFSKLNGFKAKKEAARVEPTEVEDSLKRLQESFAQYKAVEGRAVAWGDFVVADYVCLIDGKETEKRNDDWFEIKEEEFLKGFSGQLIGANPGDEKEVRLVFPKTVSRKEWAGKEALFRVKVKEIKIKELPELNDEFARGAGEYQSVADLRDKLAKDLLDAKEKEKENSYEKALLEELVKHNKIDLPAGVIKKRQQYLVEETLEQSKRHGIPEDKTEEMKKELEGTAEKEARTQVHLAFLLDELAAKENLTATEEDLKKKYEVLAGRFRQTVEGVEKYYQGHEDAREALCDQIRNEKAIEFLKRNNPS
ncbi:MAG: trigger factor [Candidatus Omnitrophota bacterium]|jgi:trigger factor